MRNILKIIIIAALALVAVFSVAQAQQNPFNIDFPIAELGNCGSMEECRVYCDESENVGACIAWAEREGVMPPAVEDEKTALVAGGKGPGGCSSPRACDAFCSQEENRDECFSFAKEHDLIQPEEIERIEQMRQKEERGGPGGCRSRGECDTFCRNPKNTQTCLQFAVDEGHLTQEEADFMLKRAQAHEKFQSEGPRGPRGPEPPRPAEPKIDEKKAEELIKTVGGPGGCASFDECHDFCNDPQNDEVCMNYAIEHDLIPEEDRARMEKMMNMEGPGGCRGRECEAYCDDESHMEECFTFAVENGLVAPEEEAEMRKFMDIAKQGGPGGCKGRDECDEYCGNPEHRDECFSFAKEHGLIPEGELRMMEREMEIVGRMEMEAGGPGGCSSPDECMAYCEDPANREECMKFGGGERRVDNFGEFGEHRDEFEGGVFPPPGDFVNQEGYRGEFPEPPEGAPYGYPPPEGYPQDMPPPDDFSHTVPPTGYDVPEEFRDSLPPEGFAPPPDGFVPPDEFENFEEGTYAPPPYDYDGGQEIEYQQYESTSEPETVSSSARYGESLLAGILNVFLGIFR